MAYNSRVGPGRPKRVWTTVPGANVDLHALSGEGKLSTRWITVGVPGATGLVLTPEDGGTNITFTPAEIVQLGGVIYGHFKTAVVSGSDATYIIAWF